MDLQRLSASAQRGWGPAAHIPALRALSDVFETAGVANTSLASAKAAAAAFGIPRAFENVAELVASPDIDVVAVTVKVPHHREVVAAALAAGKHVYCEWPLGNGLAEAIELADLARESQARAVVGTQATASPEVELVRKLVADHAFELALVHRLQEPGGDADQGEFGHRVTPFIHANERRTLE